MNPKTTAIVFQGAQVDFCTPEGKLYPLLEAQLIARNFVPKLVDLIQTQRAFEINGNSIKAADEILQNVNSLRR